MKKNFLSLLFVYSVFTMGSPFSQAAEIAWHKGSVEQAFAQAKLDHKPMLIYWGAIWCPPCEALKVQVFHETEFVATSQKFIMVFLDGDTQDAQIWGEKLGATGYPTLIVLNENGEEVQRLRAAQSAAGLTAELSQAGENSKTIEQLLNEAVDEKNPEKISQQSWSRLVRHGWDYNPKWDGRKDELTKKLVTLSEKIPSAHTQEKTAFQLLVLKRRLAAVKPDEKIDEKQRLEGLELVTKIINDKNLTSQFKYELLSGETFAKGFFPKPADDKIVMIRFVMSYRKALWQLAEDKSLTLQERGYVLSTISELSSGGNVEYPSLSAIEVKKLKQALMKDLNSAKTTKERVVIFNVLPYTFKKIGAIDEARKLILKYENKVGVKNLIYTLLADLDMDEGQMDSALKWSEKAYTTSTGPATRTQWGNNYLQLLLEVAPERTAVVWEKTLQIVDEGLSVQDGLSGRSARSLNRLKTSVVAWAEKQKQTFPTDKLTLIEKNKCTGDSEFTKRCHEYIKGFAFASNDGANGR